MLYPSDSVQRKPNRGTLVNYHSASANSLRALTSAQSVACTESARVKNVALVCANSRSLLTREASDLASATAQHARIVALVLNNAHKAHTAALRYAVHVGTVSTNLRFLSLVNRALHAYTLVHKCIASLRAVSVARAAFVASLSDQEIVTCHNFSATSQEIVTRNKKTAMLGNIASPSLPMYVRDLAQTLNLPLDRTSVHVPKLSREQAAIRLACSVHAFAHTGDALAYQTVLANIAAFAAAQLVQSDNYRQTLPTLHPTAPPPEPFPMPIKHACSTSLEWQTNPSIGVNPLTNLLHAEHARRLSRV